MSMDDDRGSKPANDMLCQIFELKAILKIHARSKFKKHFFLYYYLHTRVLVRMKKFAERYFKVDLKKFASIMKLEFYGYCTISKMINGMSHKSPYDLYNAVGNKYRGYIDVFIRVT